MQTSSVKNKSIAWKVRVGRLNLIKTCVSFDLIISRSGSQGLFVFCKCARLPEKLSKEVKPMTKVGSAGQFWSAAAAASLH